MNKEKGAPEYLIQKTSNKSLYKIPRIEVTMVEIEQGIAAGSASASVAPGSTNGNVDQVQTNWGGNDDTSIDTPF